MFSFQLHVFNVCVDICVGEDRGQLAGPGNQTQVLRIGGLDLLSHLTSSAFWFVF